MELFNQMDGQQTANAKVIRRRTVRIRSILRRDRVD